MPVPSALLALVALVSSQSAQDPEAQKPESPDPESQDAHERPPLPSPEEIAALPPDGGPDFNRLVFAASPYLLQHAANPVDWYPWGEEAFAAARAADKPVFLSIGYSTCHWCHVMERESFEDAEVAALMNEHFVCIKVDREERPDLDHQYMAVTQSLTGSGGWPMTVVMTADKKPFFAGTYFPKHTRHPQRPGMMDLIPRIAELWETEREALVASADQIAEVMARTADGAPGGTLDRSVLAKGERQLLARFDPQWGGLARNPPKFPIPHSLLFLLQRHQRGAERGEASGEALAAVEKTLVEMRKGGIFDQVGFGFHRYSTDAYWLLPHFEKMLYDQALHVMAYTAAWQVTGDDRYRDVAREVLTYVLRDMTSPEGGFYSAEDADSEGEEGLFYLWTTAELDRVLGAEESAFVQQAFNVHPEGNFVEEATQRMTRRNILHLTRSLAEQAEEQGVDPDEYAARWEAARSKLFEHRETRVHPLKDDKILTDWNGLMIAAFARAGQAFDDPGYTAAARRAADFALTTLRTEEGRLHKRYRAGQAGLPGTLEDYAFLAWGLIELYEASFDEDYLREAIGITETMLAHFEDPVRGGFFLSADDVDDLITRGKEAYDGAIPAGASIAAWNLLRLARLTGRMELEDHALRSMALFSRTAARNPSAHTQLMAAVDFVVGPSFEIVVAGDPAADDTRALLRAFRRRHLPNKVLVLRPPGAAPPITELIPYTAAQLPVGGQATAYVCRDFACKAPTTDVEEALGHLDPRTWSGAEEAGDDGAGAENGDGDGDGE